MLEEIMQRMAQQGYKLTGKRRSIVEILLAGEGHLRAKEITGKLRETYPQVSLDTIYRNLNLLTHLRIVDQLPFEDGSNGFSISGKQHHHHLVCLSCGDTVKLRSCPMELADVDCRGYKVVSHRFEIYGYCQQCQ